MCQIFKKCLLILAVFLAASSGFGKKPHLLLVSIDGYRHDYTEKYRPPFLTQMLSEGMSHGKSLQPIFPSLTFPNHLSIITGLYPEHHGITGNDFYSRSRNQVFHFKDSKDSSWYKGKTFWTYAQEKGLKTASCLWPMSDVENNAHRPNWAWSYTENVTHQNKVDQILNWLRQPEDNRPQFLTLYFHEVDKMGHRHGPDSFYVENAIYKIDQTLQHLWGQLQSLDLDINLVIVSDHGMTQVDKEHTIYLSEVLGTRANIIGAGAIAHLYVEDQDLEKIHLLLQADNRFEAYRPDELPENYKLNHPDTLGDFILVTKAPYNFKAHRTEENRLSPGSHGYDPAQNKDMHGVFYAVGPQIRKHQVVESFENIHIFPFLAKTLGLGVDHKIDGRLDVLQALIP